MASGFGRGFLVGFLVGGFGGFLVASVGAVILMAALGLLTALSGHAGLSAGEMQAHRDKVGQTLTREVTGRTTGNVWGTDVYTDDSDLGTAAVHAGVLKDGETGTVQVTVLPGQQSYPGSTRNGVTSQNWGSWQGSFQVARAGGGSPVGPKQSDSKTAPVAGPGTLESYRGKVNQTFTFEVTGRRTGTVYGTDVYTDDSDLATAAVHAGVLKDGERGVVRVTVLPGMPSYAGSTRNGVTSSEWPSWVGSFRFER